MAQQTAVEWLVEQLKERGYAGQFPPHLLFEQAKQMEKEQIINAANLPREKRWYNAMKYKNCGEQYYNETYGNP